MWWLFSGLSSAIFLLSIVLSVPLAFDVGGRDSGLAYSLALFLFYIFYSSSKLLTPERSRVRWFFTTLVGWSQWIVIPALLIWALNRFSVDAGSTWVERTFSHVTNGPKTSSWSDWFFGRDGVVETVALGGWDKTLSYSSPIFQLLEGFCSLLVIQAAGQITRWLVNRGRSDTWVVRPRHARIMSPANANSTTDYPSRLLGIRHLERRLLSLADRPLPSDQQPRRYAHWRDHDLCGFPLCFRHR